MAPNYRANNQSRRANRSYVDHDVFEGLPIRNWRRDIINIAPPPIRETSNQMGKWGVELPWGMPKDAHLLPKHSQDLLRAARSGRLYIRRRNGEEEEVDVEAATGDKPEKKEKEPKEKGYSVKTWKLVPKNQEGPEIEFLAKRRKGLIGRALKAADVTGSTLSKTRVRRTDAAGNAYFEDIIMEDGQSLEGDVITQTFVADSSTGKLAVDGITVQPTPPRRRHPPPKRRAKGPGRGRKRKLPQAPTSISEQIGGVKIEASNDVAGAQDSGRAPDDAKRDDSDKLNVENENEDTEMGDDNIIQSDEEGEEGSDDDDLSEGEVHDDHEDGDEDDNGPNGPQTSLVAMNESIDDADDNGNNREHQRDTSSSPELPLAMITSTPGHEHGNAGSPLRNVVTFAASYEERSPDVISDGEAGVEAEGDVDGADHGDDQEILDTGKEDPNMPDPYNTLEEEGFSLPHVGDEISMVQAQDYTQGHDMLLDGDMSGVGFGNVSMGQEQYLESYTEEEEIMPILVHEDQDNMPASSGEHLYQETDLSMQDTMTDAQGQNPPEEAREEEDTFEDLLGSLEDHLNEQDLGPEREQTDDYTKEDEVDHIPIPEQPEAPSSSSPAGALPTMPEKEEGHVDVNVGVNADVDAK